MPERAHRSVLAAPGMVALLAAVILGFCGFSLLLPASPSWVVHGGGDEVAAGSVTTVLMVFTIIAQLVVNRVLRSIGWTATLTASLLLLGIPAPVQALSSSLELVLATSALRGVGFGFLTVCAATALTLIVPPSQRGKAVGAYGLAVALPQLVFASSAPILADVFGTQAVLVVGALPVIAVLWIIPLGKKLTDLTAQSALANAEAEGKSIGDLLAVLWTTLASLVIVTSTGGALLTFANLIAPNSALATFSLLAMTGFATPTRWAAGALSDRLGADRMIPCFVLITVVAACALGASLVAGAAWQAHLLLVGASLLGMAYGGLQSATLVRAFDQGGASNAPRVSVMWNITFDLGTGIGALVVGAIAASMGFGFAFASLAMVALAGLVLLRPRSGSFAKNLDAHGKHGRTNYE